MVCAVNPSEKNLACKLQYVPRSPLFLVGGGGGGEGEGEGVRYLSNVNWQVITELLN